MIDESLSCGANAFILGSSHGLGSSSPEVRSPNRPGFLSISVETAPTSPTPSSSNRTSSSRIARRCGRIRADRGTEVLLDQGLGSDGRPPRDCRTGTCTGRCDRGPVIVAQAVLCDSRPQRSRIPGRGMVKPLTITSSFGQCWASVTTSKPRSIDDDRVLRAGRADAGAPAEGEIRARGSSRAVGQQRQLAGGVADRRALVVEGPLVGPAELLVDPPGAAEDLGDGLAGPGEVDGGGVDHGGQVVRRPGSRGRPGRRRRSG